MCHVFDKTWHFLKFKVFFFFSFNEINILKLKKRKKKGLYNYCANLFSLICLINKGEVKAIMVAVIIPYLLN